MKKAYYKVIFFLCLSNSFSYADYENSIERACAVCPSVGETNKIMILVPGNKSGKKSSGKYYDIGDDGRLNLRWEVNWYTISSKIFISNDSLVRIRLIRLVDESNPEELSERSLLEFYQKGTLIKVYKVKEITNLDENLGKMVISPTSVYDIFALSNNLAPKIVTELEYEVNTEEQYSIINKKGIEIGDIFKVDVIGGDRIFFRMSTGELLYRFKYKYKETSVLRGGNGN